MLDMREVFVLTNDVEMSQSSKPNVLTSLTRVNSLPATANAANKVRVILMPSNFLPLSLSGMLTAAPTSSAHGAEQTWSRKGQRVVRWDVGVSG